MKFLVFAILFAVSNFAYAGGCYTQRSEGYQPSICRGGKIPTDRTRNFSQQRLECTSNSDNYIRRPQKFDFNKWKAAFDSSDPQDQRDAFKMRQALPDIQWQGTIPYETVEKWSWQACEYHQSASECGTHQECHTVSDEECSTNSNGKESCHTVEKEECEAVANYCWYDVDYEEAQHCSDEVVNYSAHFARDKNWNINSPYATIIPNKYDLMPAEIENIQTYDNSGSSTQLHPHVDILNAWNQYDTSSHLSGSAVGAQCRQDATYDLHAEIVTIKRDTGMKAPNAFRLPVDVEGHPGDAFNKTWSSANYKGQLVNTRPAKLMLADSSAAMMESIAEVSRKSKQREMTKVQEGRGQNPDGLHMSDANDSSTSGFFKNTIVRIKLIKENSWWWNSDTGAEIKTDDVKSVRASGNTDSRDQDVKFADNYEFELDSPTNIKENIYRRVLDGLLPNRVYELQVSMYQKKVPFYQQSCEDDPKHWYCLAYRWTGHFDTESKYFSEPLKVRFETPKADVNRNFLQWMNGTVMSPFSALGEWIVHTRTTGQNNGTVAK